MGGLILLMDIRHPLQDYDRQMLNWAAQAGLPVHILLTKSDKLKRGPAQSTLLKVDSFLREMDPRNNLADSTDLFITQETGIT